MIKAIVVAADYRQFATYIRNRRLNRSEYGFYIWDEPQKSYGLDKFTTKVLWLEGWSDGTTGHAPQDIAHGIKFLKSFHTHSNVSEVWIYGKNSFV